MKRVYFARLADGTGPIKIGCSEYIPARIRQIEIDMRAKIAVLAEAPGGFADERNLHIKFAADRAPRLSLPHRKNQCFGATEWFHATPALLAYIEIVIEAGRIELADHERRELVFASRRRAGETLQAIGRDYGISRQRVHQIISQAEALMQRSIPVSLADFDELELTPGRIAA